MKNQRPPTAKQIAWNKKVATYNDARTAEVETKKTVDIIKLIRKGKQ